MEDGFCRHDTGTSGCCRVGDSDEGESTNRLEHAAAALALENSLNEDSNIVIRINPTVPWIQFSHGLVRDTNMIHKFPDSNILWDVIELLMKRIEKGLFTLFVKIRAHRGEFLNSSFLSTEAKRPHFLRKRIMVGRCWVCTGLTKERQCV